MSSPNHPLWDLAAPIAMATDDTHPLWKQAAADSGVIITPKSAEKEGLVGSALSAINPADLVKSIITHIGHGDPQFLAQPDDAEASVREMVKGTHESAKKALDALNSGDYAGATKHASDILFNSIGVKGVTDKAEKQVAEGDYGGAIGTGLGSAALLYLLHKTPGAINAGAEGLSGLRKPDPDWALKQAVKPHAADIDFREVAPNVRAQVKRGESLADTKIEDVPTALKATQAAMDEHMQALDAHVDKAMQRGDRLPTSVIKQKMIDSLPDGLESRNPQEYNDAVAEINGLFGGKHYLDAKEVMEQSHLSNGKLSRFHASPEAAQNSKLVTNGGDTGVLKGEGDLYRQWINEHVGSLASDINGEWGQLNGFKHYLQAKLNPADLEEPGTAVGRGMEKIGINPSKISNFKDLVGELIRHAAGQPTKINDLLKSAFDQSEAAKSPVEPNKYESEQPLNPFNRPSGQPQLPAGNADIRIDPNTGNYKQYSGVHVLDPSGNVIITPENEISAAFRAAAQTPEAGQPQLPAPAPGEPPVNILPAGAPGAKHSVGPASPVVTTSKETPIPQTAKGFTPKGETSQTANQAARRDTVRIPELGPDNIQDLHDLNLNRQNVARKLTGKSYDDLQGIEKTIVKGLVDQYFYRK